MSKSGLSSGLVFFLMLSILPPRGHAQDQSHGTAQSEGVAQDGTEPPADKLSDEEIAEMEAILEDLGLIPPDDVAEDEGQLGAELRGFDLSVLRSARRVEKWRHELTRLQGSTTGKNQRSPNLSCSLEFGRESGKIEARMKDRNLHTVVEDLIGEFTSAALLSTGGKILLRERILTAVNRRLTTARVRQVYLTEFRLEAVN